MAATVDEGKHTAPSLRKRQHSSELLQSPKGAGVSFMMREFPAQREETAKRPCVLQICGSKSQRIRTPSKTFKVERSSVLGRVQSFLPQLKEADQELSLKLQSESKGDLDIENVEEGEACIEMDLAIVPFLTPDCDGGSDLDSSDNDSSDDDSSDNEQTLDDHTHTIVQVDTVLSDR